MCVLLSAAYTVRVKMLMLRKRACLRKAGLIAAVMKRAVLSFTQCRYPVNSVSPLGGTGIYVQDMNGGSQCHTPNTKQTRCFDFKSQQIALKKSLRNTYGTRCSERTWKCAGVVWSVENRSERNKPRTLCLLTGSRSPCFNGSVASVSVSLCCTNGSVSKGHSL